MSVATRNPFALLDDDLPSEPSPPIPATQNNNRTNQKPRAGGKYYSRGGGNSQNRDAGDEPADAADDSQKFQGIRDGRGRGRGRGTDGGRVFDKHSQTGKTDSDKKFHQGWGGDDGNVQFKQTASLSSQTSTELKGYCPGMKPLYFNDGPLVWIDCEMTGLDPRKDKIIEIAVLITNGDLEIVDSGIEYVIRTDKELLDGMDSWCTEQHGQSGLTQACLDSPHTLEFVADKVLNYIKKWIPKQRTGVLAGNSVHVDRIFLAAEMPAVIDWLHYRIVDVSSIKELSRRWYAREGIPPITVKNGHRALADIIGSIEELRWYRQNIFVAPSTILQRSNNSPA